MKKITQKFLLFSGFKYSFYDKKIINKRGLGEFTVLWNCIYKFSYYRFDYELDGEIEEEIIAFKTIGCWIIISNSQVHKINYEEELLNLSLPIKKDNETYEFVYIINSAIGYKIGRTKNIDNRSAIFNVKLPFEWSFYDIHIVKDSKRVEKLFHLVFKNKRINGEWYDLNAEDLNDIKRFLQTPYSP